MPPEAKRVVPIPTPETKPFWQGTREGELRLQRCDACAHVYFPPRPFCPKCAGRAVSWFAASGRGSLYSYIIHHRPVPGFTPPYSIAVVQLDEGPRMMTNVVGCAPENVKIGMAVQVVYEDVTPEITLAKFKPV